MGLNPQFSSQSSKWKSIVVARLQIIGYDMTLYVILKQAYVLLCPM